MSISPGDPGQFPGPGAPQVPHARLDRRQVVSGFLFGCGIAASVIDLFIFHLVLQWHHFYDRSTPEVALIADGFFHAFGWFITVAGLFLLADVRRRSGINWRRWAGATATGVGLFQLFDGVVNHKVLRIHQIRYDVDVLPYDVVWIGSALIILAVGSFVLWRTRPREARATTRGREGT
ncbi:membrane protein [Pseudoclavibacter endophyticus]|uniref:DUF2243 domain-containing protein n=1 Tax=Pseudoclavibacter endophyticus TaxID=1778590 RepID=A0A6H9WP15_9MICO|nr:DUF2243 domain-containing protein [Pseudoclavibacter endophyticus]KAB1649461.1 DUF2243 domain-containing protein [Pseudoclavibacter endophyticus]GGA62470.1 membrane protein [Pseudoclavibacter endophyticus]